MFEKKIVLVSAPWPLFSRPSIQLAALKAYLKKQVPDVEVCASHFFLKVAEAVGYDLYGRVCERTWLAEAVYGALLHPERFDRIERLFKKNARGKQGLEEVSFERLVRDVERTSLDFVASTDWSACGLAGFSICLCQLTSSLYLMREIKASSPETILLAGGSLLCADTVEGMLDCFPQIDAAIVGEGERPLAGLVGNLAKYGSLDAIPRIKGVVVRNGGQSDATFDQLSDLGSLPPPDFEDYFRSMDGFSPEKKFFASLPMEISRGCWHRSRTGPKGEKGCAFCNLNLQWKGFRSKSPEQVLSEIENSTSRYRLLSVSFMDNALPPKQTPHIFGTLPSLGKDFSLFCELRAKTDLDTLKTLRRAGLCEVQVGVEALGTNLLRKINKGTTALDNLEIMKNCEALSIANQSNLLLHFPGSDETDVEQTLRAIEFARFFRPLRVVYFWLGLESPVYCNPGAYGLKAVFNHPDYGALFPSETTRRVKFMIQDYRGDKTRQRKLWKPVEEAVEQWKKEYGALHGISGAGAILGYRDGRDFLIVRRRRIGAKAENHRLAGTSRQIYLFCGHARSMQEICERFPTFAEEKILAFLNMMIQKRLMYGEDGKYLSLAVPDFSNPTD